MASGEEEEEEEEEAGVGVDEEQCPWGGQAILSAWTERAGLASHKL